MIEEKNELTGQILSSDNNMSSLIEKKETLEGQLISSGNIIASLIAQKGARGEKGDTGSQGIPGVSPTATINKVGKVATITITDVQGTTTAEIRDGEDGLGSGDMLKATYDTNNNGIVDNAEKVNNHTVESNVPANAVFTDTTYTAGTGIDITYGVISNTQPSAEWGNISGTITDQTDLKNALDGKANSSDLSSVATSGSYNDLSNKPTIPTKISDLNNDSDFIETSSTAGLVKNDGTIDTTSYSTFSGSYTDLSNKPTIPTNTSDLTNDTGFITDTVETMTCTKNIAIPKNSTNGYGLTNSDGTSIIRDWNNQCVTVNATGSTLYLGHQTTNDINILNGKAAVESTGAIKATNGIYSTATGSVGTAVGNGNLIIKKANNTEAPNNGVVLEFGNSANWTGQLYIGDNSTQGCYFNGWSNGTRGTWKKLVFLEDVVESGSNANGYYTKYGDGTLICRGTVGPVTTNAGTSASKAVTLPYSFVDTNWTGTLTKSAGGANWAMVGEILGNITTTGFTISTWNNSTAQAPNIYYNYIAVGKWK